MATASKAKLAIKAGTYYNSGNFASPSWVEITCIENWQVSPNWQNAEIRSRATRMILNAKTLAGLTISGRVLASDTGDGGYNTILAAINNDDTLDIMALNGSNTTNGATGYRMECQVHFTNESQNPDEVIYDEVEFRPAFTGNNPQSVTVTAGAPVFTELAPN